MSCPYSLLQNSLTSSAEYGLMTATLTDTTAAIEADTNALCSEPSMHQHRTIRPNY
jgi:hypothetical protein